VGIDDQGPAESVDHYLVVVGVQEHAADQAGLTAVGFVRGVMDLAGAGGLVAAAGPLAVPAAEPGGMADPRRDGPGVPDVQGQAGAAEAAAELAAAQEAGQAAEAGQQFGGLADDGLLQGLPRPVGGDGGQHLAGSAGDSGRTGAGRGVGTGGLGGPVAVAGFVVVLVFTGLAATGLAATGLAVSELVAGGVMQELVELGAEPDQVTEGGRVHVPDHDRGDGGAAGDPAGGFAVQPQSLVAAGLGGGGAVPGPLGRQPRRPLLDQFGAARQLYQVGQRDVGPDPQRLPGPLRHQSARDQPPHRFLEGIVVPLLVGPV